MSDRFRLYYNDDAIKEGIATSDDLWRDGWGMSLWEFIPGKKPRLVGTDGGEPEDQTLSRDWSWVQRELNKLAGDLEKAEKALADTILIEGERDMLGDLSPAATYFFQKK